MKKILPAFLLLLLASCSTVNYEQLKLSNAIITDVNVANTSSEQVDLVFNYNIDDFNNVKGVYACSINFVGSAIDSWLSIRHLGGMKCNISEKSGTIHFVSRTPLDKSGQFRNSTAQQHFKIPLQYFVAMTQKTGSGRGNKKIIAKSNIYTLKMKDTD